MIRNLTCATLLLVLAGSASAAAADDGHNAKLASLISHHAAANDVPEALVRRIIRRESRGNARAVSKGNYGLMQIRLGTARAMGYRGSAAGLLDADTNMTYAVKYLAGAYRAAGGNPDRAVHYYAAGYYYAAKRKGLTNKHAASPARAFASADAAEIPRSVAARSSALLKTSPHTLKARIEQARANGNSNVSTSSDMYTGKIDHF
jgi:soluble lytic murein transglycosylase-like protein